MITTRFPNYALTADTPKGYSNRANTISAIHSSIINTYAAQTGGRGPRRAAPGMLEDGVSLKVKDTNIYENEIVLNRPK